MSSANVKKVEALVAKAKYEDAVKMATSLLSKDSQNGKTLIARSVAYLRLGMFKESLEDAEKAVVYTDGVLQADAQLRRAFALQRLGEDGKALSVLRYAKNCEAPNRYDMLMQKLKGSTPIDISEIPKGIPPLTSESKSSVKAADATSSIKQETPVAAADASSAHVAPLGPSSATPSVRKDWYQSSASVNMDVYLRGAQDKNPKVTIDEQSVSIEYEDVDFMVKLAHPINTDKSTFSVSPYKFSFVLAKAVPMQWGSLECRNTEDLKSTKTCKPKEIPKANLEPQAASHRQESRPRYKAAFEKNWDNIDSDDDEGPSGDPNDFFSQIYKNADPDTQRAMMKSFVESKGTTLSTNWDEVKQGIVEPLPPKDMNIS